MPPPSPERTPSAPRRFLWAAALVAVLAPKLVLAQASRPIGQGLQWGRVNVFPSMSFDYGYNDNIFYASDASGSDSLVESRQFNVQPRLLFDMPLGENWLRWAYAPVYRNYSTDQYTPTEQWSHTFDLDGRLDLGGRFYSAFRDRFVRGTQELREVDPGGELTFGDVPFDHHTPTVEVGYRVGVRQAVSVVWSYRSVQFDETRDAGFYNYRGHGLQARYNYAMRRGMTVYLYAGTDETTQVRFSPTPATIDLETRGTGVGLTQVLNRVVTTSITAGYQAIDYTGGSGTNYHGPSVAGRASFLLGDVMQLSFIVRRQPYSSFYLNNNYYLNRNLGVDVTRQVGTAWYWRAGIGYENNTYSDDLDIGGLEDFYCLDPTDPSTCPSAGKRRRDSAWRYEAGVGFQASNLVRWYVGYNGQSRTSNVLQVDAGGFSDAFAYDVNWYFLRIEVGWL